MTTIIGMALTLVAQDPVELPYFTSFETPAEKAGWTEFKTAATTFSHWEYDDANGFRSLTSIHHDYSPSTGITLTDNWFVSPEFLIEDGGVLDSIRFRFTGFSVPGELDTIAVYLFVGNQDPDLASKRTLLFDFRGDEYSPDGIYRQIADIDLMPSDEPCFLAIRYRNSNCSEQWISVDFDNIAIREVANAGVNKFSQNNPVFTIYPNPASEQITILFDQKVETIHISNVIGKVIYTQLNNTLSNKMVLDITDYTTGIYFITVETENKTFTQKIMID